MLNSSLYSEKQIGYLAVTLFLHEHHDLTSLVVNSIQKDLNSKNEVFNCLALHAIANLSSRQMAETLTPTVQALLLSP